MFLTLQLLLTSVLGAVVLWDISIWDFQIFETTTSFDVPTIDTLVLGHFYHEMQDYSKNPYPLRNRRIPNKAVTGF